MSFVKHAVIAAAGLGSRLGLGRPKCLLEVAGKSLLEHQLKLLEGVADIRVVVGFEESDVVAAAKAIRSDIIFVRNPAFRTTTTLASYALGAKGVVENCLYMDADILFEPSSFASFIEACGSTDQLIAVTPTKTADAVYVEFENEYVHSFSRSRRTAFEWANLCWLPASHCENGSGAVFERLAEDLPIRAHNIESFEIDTPVDLQNVLKNCDFINT